MEPVKVKIPNNLVNAGHRWTLCDRALSELVIYDKTHEDKFKAVLIAQRAYQDAISELRIAIGSGIQFKFESAD